LTKGARFDGSAGMARSARLVIPGMPHHVIQRQNRRHETLFNDGEYAAYLELMASNHARDGPAAFLKEYRGYLQDDAFGGHDGIYLQWQGRIIEVGCWTHARRNFYDARRRSISACWPCAYATALIPGSTTATYSPGCPQCFPAPATRNFSPCCPTAGGRPERAAVCSLACQNLTFPHGQHFAGHCFAPRPPPAVGPRNLPHVFRRPLTNHLKAPWKRDRLAGTISANRDAARDYFPFP